HCKIEAAQETRAFNIFYQVGTDVKDIRANIIPAAVTILQTVGAGCRIARRNRSRNDAIMHSAFNMDGAAVRLKASGVLMHNQSN
ncbi:hypothetical protein LSI99_26440, partial [Klebsiella quasipneumoniae subsp. similipneumoniae]|uniref:hypothetical protein n=1 Tax=Klebsiella quasipneumoniae TaxID=1463165 RepID=UPI001E44797F